MDRKGVARWYVINSSVSKGLGALLSIILQCTVFAKQSFPRNENRAHRNRGA